MENVENVAVLVDKPKKVKKDRKKLYHYTPEEDIKYRGPLSYRGLRIIGWVLFALAQIGVILTLGGKANPDMVPSTQGWIHVFNVFGQMMMPLFLLANFSFILRSHKTFKKRIIMYTIMTLGFAAIYYLLYEHYVIGFLDIFIQDKAQTRAFLDELFEVLIGSGIKALNVFLDLLLCTLVYYFLVYNPKKFFQGKKIIIFRLLAILPIVYEAVSITLKLLSVRGVINMSPYALPFLTCKPPLTFVAFVAIALFFKFRKQYIFRHTSNSEDHYEAFLTTNANSWHVSKAIAIIFTLATVIDFFIVIIVMIVNLVQVMNGGGGEAAADMAINVMIVEMTSMGFGDAVALILVVPFVLLFSYNKVPPKPEVDLFLPIAGIALVAIVYLEGFFQLSRTIPDLLEKLIKNIIGEGGEK